MPDPAQWPPSFPTQSASAIRAATTETLPDDLRAAIEANPRVKKTLATLNRQNLFALAYRTNAMKTAACRARKIATLVAMLARGKTISPNPAPSKPTAKKALAKKLPAKKLPAKKLPAKSGTTTEPRSCMKQRFL